MKKLKHEIAFMVLIGDSTYNKSTNLTKLYFPNEKSAIFGKALRGLEGMLGCCQNTFYMNL